MNELGIALIWSAAQVTLVGLIGLLLCGFTVRRDPRAGVLVATTALAATLLLTVVALSPLPEFWRWPITTDPRVAPSRWDEPLTSANRADNGPAGLEHSAARNDEASPTGLGLTLLRGLWLTWSEMPRAVPQQRWHWSGMVTVAFGLGAAVCLLRVLLGFWAVRGWRKRSTTIRDGALLELLDSLRSEMGCRRPVEVRVCAELTGPATLGWWRPLLMLPAGWQSWSAAELRAVLAHELAHIRAADYLAWLLARVSVALHFYHPLMYWLADQLQLQQELAADALGARFAGGRRTYLQALAQLALRQEDQPAYGPARAFLPVHGTLMRRIQMLRNKEEARNPAKTWLPRGVALALLLGAALGVSGLRGAGAAVVAETSEEKTPAQATHAPFDLSYVDENAFGVLALRPAALLARPGMKPVADLVNLLGMDVGFLPFGFNEKLDLKAEDIEQIIGAWVHSRNEAAPEGARNSLTARLVMIRTVRPFDWKQKLQTALGVELVEERLEGKVFWKAKTGIPGLLPAGFRLYLPDERTLVMPNSKDIHRVLQHGKDRRPKFAWAEAWNLVERGWFAMAIRNTDKQWLQSLKEDGARDPQLAFLLPILTNTRSFAFGIRGTKQIVCQAVAECETEDKRLTVANAARAATTLARTAVTGAAARKDLKPLETAALQFATDLVKSAKFCYLEHPAGQHAVMLEADATLKVELAELLAEFVRGELKVDSSDRK